MSLPRSLDDVLGPNQLVQESVYSKFSPKHIALGEQFAKRATENNDLGGFMSNARMGLGPEEQSRMDLEQKLAGLTQQFTDATKDLDDNAYRQAAEQFKAKFGAPMPERKQAQLQAPNALQSGFAILGMALNPEYASDIAAATLQGNVQARDQQQQRFDQEFDDQTRKQDKELRGAQAGMDIERRALDDAQNNQQAKLGVLDRQIRDVQSAIEKLDEKDRKTLEGAKERYDRANLPGEKLKAGRELQELLGKGNPLAPTDEEIAQDVQQITARNLTSASTVWNATIKSHLNEFGEVDDVNFKNLEEQRLAVATQFGINPDILRKTPTGRTIKEEQIQLSRDKFGFLKEKTAEDFKVKWANLQIAKQRANTYQQAVSNGLSMGMTRNQIAAGHLAIRNVEAQAKAVANSAMSQVKNLIGKIGKETDPDKQAKLRGELNMLAQELAGEFGMDPSQFIKNPIAAIQEFTRLMQEEEENRKAQLEGVAPMPVDLSGVIGNAGTGTKPSKVPSKQSAYNTTKSGIKYRKVG